LYGIEGVVLEHDSFNVITCRDDDASADAKHFIRMCAEQCAGIPMEAVKAGMRG
jgi:hypothetical protein